MKNRRMMGNAHVVMLPTENIEARQLKNNLPEIPKQSDVVEFIEWAHHWAVRLGKNKWLYNKQTDGISTLELYSIFKKQNP